MNSEMIELIAFLLAFIFVFALLKHKIVSIRGMLIVGVLIALFVYYVLPLLRSQI